MPPGMHPVVRFIVIFCLQHWVYFILFVGEMQGKIISLICIYCNIFIKSIFVQINFNKMLLNKSKYKVFLAIFVYMSHNIFINIQRGFPPQHGDFHEHFILRYGKLHVSGYAVLSEAAWSYLQNVILPLPQ